MKIVEFKPNTAAWQQERASQRNPDDIFLEDELISALKRKERELREELCAAIGESPEEAVIGLRFEDHWPAEARPIFEEYRQVVAEVSRRNSRKCVEQVSRFMEGAKDGTKMTGEMMHWWINRY